MSKWFNINEGMKKFESKRRADTIKEAWSKTIEKWSLIVNGYTNTNDLSSCGLCNLFFHYGCITCPVYETTLKTTCKLTPYTKWVDNDRKKEDAEHELMFLLTVKEFTN